MIGIDTRDKYCIIGAGSSGLTVAKNFKAHDVAFDVIERESQLGGNWCYGNPHSSVYQSTHLISSKPMTQYVDYPFPEEYPDYPGHRLVWKYLESYARDFGFLDTIEFGRSVQSVTPREEGWEVTLDGDQTRQYRGVVIANGHLWDPKFPQFKGHFDGQTMHSADYKTADVLRGRRVLVVGAGNSGCDIAVESAQHAARTFHSTRRGYYYLPKYFMGMPSDQLGERMLRWRAPLWMRRMVASLLAKMVLGWPQDYGLPKPDHKLLESHPIVNSQMLYYVGHGDIGVKPDVAQLCGQSVRFADGSEEDVDLIIYATGFHLSFPFIEQQHLNWQDHRPKLFLMAFHPRYDNLFVAGLLQPDSGQFGLVDYQAQLMARFVAAQRNQPAAAERFRRLKSTGDTGQSRRIHYLDSSRHLLEVEHYGYRRKLKKAIAMFK
jgi:cation diffusion facilitator CzcD-associated flavoprotein CzcO